MKQILKIFTWQDILEYTSKNYYIIDLPVYNGEIFKRLLYNNYPYPEYLISNYGRLYSIRSCKLLKYQQSEDDYDRVTISVDGNKRTILIQRAVQNTFNPIMFPYEYTSDHISGDHHDNSTGNLRWLTNIENIKEGHRKGYIDNRGDNNPQSIFTEREVHRICQLLEQKMTYDEILNELNVDKNKDIKLLKKAIYSIMCRETYVYISEYYNFERYDMNNYTYKSNIDYICQLLSEGKSKDEICKLLDIEKENINTFKSYLSGILRGKYYKDIAIKYNLIDENKAIFTIQQVHEICKCIINNLDNRDVCINLGIDFDNLEHHTKSNLTREINKIRNKVIYTYISDEYF